MITSVYIAGASSEITRARAARTQLLAGGLVVASTWPDVVSKVGAANPRDASMAQLTQWALQDLAEVHDADVLWLLLPFSSHHTVGAWIELGAAYTAGKRIVMSGPHHPIFTPVLADTHHELDHDAAVSLIQTHEALCKERVQTFMTRNREPW